MTAATRCAARVAQIRLDPLAAQFGKDALVFPLQPALVPCRKSLAWQFAPAIGAKRFRSRPRPRRPSRIRANRRGAVHCVATGKRSGNGGSRQSPGNRTSSWRPASFAAVFAVVSVGETVAASGAAIASHTRSSAVPRAGRFHSGLSVSQLAIAVRCRRCLARVAPTYSRRAELGRFLRGIEPAEPRVHGIGFRVRAEARAHRCEHQRRRALVFTHFPTQKRLVAVARAEVQAGQDHGVELQPLRAVQRHDLHGVRALVAGFREQPLAIDISAS